jgi:hypothetical protein
MPAKAGIQQARGSAPKESFAPADAGALDSRFRGNDNSLVVAGSNHPRRS